MKKRANKHIKAKKGSNEKAEIGNSANEWRSVFDSTLGTLHSGGWIPNIVVTLIFALLGPVIGVFLNTQKTIIIGVASGITILVWVIAIIMFRATPSPNPPPATNLSQPVFQPSTTYLTLVLGGQSFKVPRQGWVDGFKPMDFSGYAPIRLYTKDDKLFADVTILGNANKPNIEIKQNQFTVRPGSWDSNSNDKAFEVVDENQRPIFQMVYQDNSLVRINGIFPIHKRLIYYANPLGLIAKESPLPPEEFKLEPIFKYPSWKYPGEYSK